MFKFFASLWCVATLTFCLMHVIPGDPFIGERPVPQEVRKALNAHFGLDQPLHIQYIKYFKGLLRGDLGPSMIYEGRSVNSFIKEGLLVSARLGFQALCVAVPTGILLGTWAALRRGRWQDHLLMLLSTLGVCIPSFVLSNLLQFVFGIKLRLLPVALWGDLSHTILPTIALASMPIAYIARLTRSSMIEQMSLDYIQTALSKGLPLFYVAIRHALRNAILPVVTYLGPVSAQILTGSFMIEKIFAIPGLGQWLIHSIGERDYPMIMGFTLFFSFILMSFIFLIDLLYPLLDPRLKR